MTTLHLPECFLQNTVNFLNVICRVILLPVTITHRPPVSSSRDANSVVVAQSYLSLAQNVATQTSNSGVISLSP